ncbi:MAG TPA: RidA family protein [Desulfobacteraceae bacterium]|nr:RidA family protein [Desulfobacteraceae bacterium]
MEKKIIQTSNAPAAVGAYSQAVQAGSLVFASGQIGLVPETGLMVEGGVGAQARRCLENLRAVLEAAGSSMEKIVMATVFLADINDFATVNEVYGEFFQVDPPARACVQAAALPKGGLVEIAAVAGL